MESATEDRDGEWAAALSGCDTATRSTWLVGLPPPACTATLYASLHVCNWQVYTALQGLLQMNKLCCFATLRDTLLCCSACATRKLLPSRLQLQAATTHDHLLHQVQVNKAFQRKPVASVR